MWLVMSPLMKYAAYLPTGRRRWPQRYGTWNMNLPSLPVELRTVAGIPRDSVAEAAAFREAPLQCYRDLHPEASRFHRTHAWLELLRVSPQVRRASEAAGRSGSVPRAPVIVPERHELTKELRARAAELGLSALGIARYDPKYTLAQGAGDWYGDTVIVCIAEEDHAKTQLAPSRAAYMAVWDATTDLVEMTAELAGFLEKKGFRARASSPHQDVLVQNYAVAAGLGQMGLNGQLLTPIAGSRCSISVIYTDAALVFDEPRDFGVPKVCDACKVCVQRCPPGAIPARRGIYRGIERIQIKKDRCFPTVAQAHGCAVCVKVCPVQKFGLQPVIDEFTKTGRILGKDTDDLEGYDWIDGRHYGPGVRPKLDDAFLHPSGWVFDPDRKLPPGPPKKENLFS